MIKKVSLVTLLTLTSLSAEAVNPLLQLSYDWGGTTLATVEHPATYYDAADINKIRAGAGLSLEAGAAIGGNQSDVELQLTVGYKFDSDSAANGEVTWDVIPFTALAMFKSNKWKLGAGVTYHLNPEISGAFSGYDNGVYFNDTINDTYNSAFGGVAKIQYRATPSLDIGLKGTMIEYELKNNPSVTAKGNSIGIVLSYAFGNERSEFR